MILAGLLYSFAGMAALCFAMDRHHRQLRHRAPAGGVRLALRVLAAVGLALALLACMERWGWSMGLVAWFGMLALGGLALVFLLPYAPRTAAWLAVAGPIIAAFLRG